MYAWRWQIKVRILSFLLGRYGDDPDLRLPPRPAANLPYTCRAELGPDYGKPPRSPAAIRAVLDRIAAVNRSCRPQTAES